MTKMRLWYLVEAKTGLGPPVEVMIDKDGATAESLPGKSKAVVGG